MSGGAEINLFEESVEGAVEKDRRREARVRRGRFSAILKRNCKCRQMEGSMFSDGKMQALIWKKRPSRKFVNK